MKGKTGWLRPGIGTLIVLGLALASQPASGALFINEIDADTVGDDTQEFIEIYNSGPATVDFGMTPYVVVLFNGNDASDGSYMAIDLTGTLPAGGLFTIGSTGMGTDVELAPGGSGWLQNGADAVALYSGMSASFANGTLPTTAGLVDAIVYDTSDPDDAALLAALGQSVQYDENGTGAKDTTSIARQPDGSTLQIGQAPTPGVLNGLPAPTADDGITILSVNNSNVSVSLVADGGTGALTYNVETLPTLGTLLDNFGAFAAPRAVNGPLRYTPNAGVSGLDSFEFTATDSNNITSGNAVQELAIQQNKVVITEVMHNPGSFDSTFEFVEIYNYSTGPVSLGSIDNTNSVAFDTTGNLTTNGVPVIPAGAMRIIAIDNTAAFPESAEQFRCDWRLAEADIIRVPFARWEFLSATSRVLLFDNAGGLLDAVDVATLDASAGGCANASLSFEPFDPPTATSNDDPLDWFCAAFGSPGLRTGDITGDSASPGYVVEGFTSYVYQPPCFGACCLTDGTCVDNTLQGECAALNCGDGSRWKQGDSCGSAVCPAAEDFGQCCLPIGECLDTSECECLLSGGDWDGAQTCATGPQCAETARLVINEIEYDGPGTDDAEYVELKAPGGVSLAGWKLEFYNGNDSAVYRTVDLSLTPGGVMPADGYLVVGTTTAPEVDYEAWDAASGFQNGPDGLVLSLGTFVVEALSYETGTNGFVAVGGTADGVLLEDPGVGDTGGTTMQKIPDGSTDPASWVATANQTPGVENFDAGAEGACCDPNTAACTRVTSIECDAAGGLFQGVGTTCGLYTCEAKGSCCEPDGGCRDDLAAEECDRLGGAWTEGGVCPDAAAFVACLTGPSAADVRGPECVSWDLDGDGLDIDLADFAIYQQLSCSADPVGACCLPDGTCAEVSQWACDTSYGPGAFQGVGVACGAASCSADPAGLILINEIWAEDPGIDDHEFIELFGPASTSLNGYSLIVVDGDTFGSTAVTQYRNVNFQADLTGYTTDANGYFLMGTGPDLVGVVDVDMDAVFGDGQGDADELQNGSQTYALVNTADIAFCTGAGVPDATCDTNGMRLTQASYDAITANAIDAVATRVGDFDHVYFFAPLVQDDGFFVFDYAQRIPNGTDTNVAGDWETVYGNELGAGADPSTPGTANSPFAALPGACCIDSVCQQLTETDCLAQAGSFLGQGASCTPNPCDCRELSLIPDVEFPVTEQVCVTNAIVSDVYDRVGSATSKHFFIQDVTGAKGWTVYGSNTEIDPLLEQIVAGDIVEMTGTHEEYFNTQELVAPFTLTVLGHLGVPAPVVTTIDDFDQNFPVNEQLLSVRVKVTNARFRAADVGTTFGATQNLTIEDATNPALTMVLRIGNLESGALPIVGTTIPAGTVEITGITTIFSDVWQIQPAVPGDIVVVGP